MRTIDGRKTTKCQLIVFIRFHSSFFLVKCVFALYEKYWVDNNERREMIRFLWEWNTQKCALELTSKCRWMNRGEGVRLCCVCFVYKFIFLMYIAFFVSIACQVSLYFLIWRYVYKYRKGWGEVQWGEFLCM